VGRELVDAWLDAFRSKDISKLKLAEGFIHTSPFGEIRGREVYLDMVRENYDAFFSKTIEVVDVIGSGNKFAVRYQVDDAPACDCIYVEDGQISKICSYYHFGDRPVLPALSRWYTG
jgi:hypothetical protein